VALLRASSLAIGDLADGSLALGRDVSDGGVAGGSDLVRYAEAVHEREGIATAVEAVIDAMGVDAAGEAAMTCAAFSGLVRVADGIGIELDDGTESGTREIRSELGIDVFGGASNTAASTSVRDLGDDVAAMFTTDSSS